MPRQRVRRTARLASGVVLVAVPALAIATAGPAAADVAGPVAGPVAAPKSLQAVIENLRDWLVSLLVALATLFLTVGGLRYLLAGGDPGEVTKARNTLKYAALGYALAALAPLLVNALQGIVGT